MAGFVGVSNLLAGDAAMAVTGEPAPFTVRPEKIRLVELEEPYDDVDWSATGRVRDVIYVGALTRYVVDLDSGGELVVIEQNLSISSMEALQARGRQVRLLWKREHNRSIADSGAPEAELEREEA